MTDTTDDPDIPYSESSPHNGRADGEPEEAAPDRSTAPFGFTPFPIDALPATAAAYVEATSEALDVAPAFLAVPMLSVLSAGVGASARLQLKRSWREPATLWTAVVAPSGSTKSAALQHVLRPVQRQEREAQDAYQQALAEHDPSGDESRPTRTRYRTGDPTTEAVVRILEENPQGVLLARDELAAWLGSFDRYAHGAADLQFWIEVWGGEQVSLDRVGEGNITVSNPAVPLTGTIQPRTLQKRPDTIHFQSGFASRLLLCRPPTTAKTWTEADVSKDLEDRYRSLLQSLYDLSAAGTSEGLITATLSTSAKERWIAFYDEANAQLHREHDGPARAARAKSINHAARLALIFQLCAAVESGRLGAVEAPALERAVTVARWGLRETLRVYETLGLGAETLDPPERFLQQLPRRFSTSEAEEVAEAEDVARRTLFKWLKDLQKDGLLTKVRRGQYEKSDAAP
jgi:hypothetical protein